MAWTNRYIDRDIESYNMEDVLWRSLTFVKLFINKCHITKFQGYLVKERHYKVPKLALINVIKYRVNKINTIIGIFLT